MQASFIIPLYNCLEHTRECLRTLQATLPASLGHEIVFVDDGSTDGTREWLASLPFPCRSELNAANLGFAGACNRGAAVARGEILFFLNNDLVLLPGWFEPMRDLLARPDAGLVGNIQLNARTGALDHAGVAFDAKGKPGHLRTRPLVARLRGWRAVPAVTGACCALRRTTWEKLGGFDPGFRNGGEDIDLALRARAAGLVNRVSLRSVVRHHVSASLGRKLRDEENSRRLAARWRADIAVLAAPAWSADYLARLWHGPHDPRDYGLAAEALALALGLRRSPSPSLLAGVGTSLEAEFIRWQRLLDGAPLISPDESVRTDQL
jgi:GT2 family glycosyltransferase